MLTWFRNQTPLFQGFLTFAFLIGTGFILHGLGALIGAPLLDVSQLMTVLFGAFMGGSINYWHANHPSGVAETLTPLEHGLLTLAVLWSETLLAMLIAWAAGLAEGDLSLLIELTALMAAVCTLLAVFAYGAAYRTQARQRDERSPDTENAPLA